MIYRTDAMSLQMIQAKDLYNFLRNIKSMHIGS
jgi:hypothetical protein